LGIGLSNGYNVIQLFIDSAHICNAIETRFIDFKLPKTFSWNDGDIFGCGLVYPPTNNVNKFPYVFFTQNGKQIGE